MPTIWLGILALLDSERELWDLATKDEILAKACSPSAATRVDPRTQRHHHLVCQRCDRLLDVDDAAFGGGHRFQGLAAPGLDCLVCHTTG